MSRARRLQAAAVAVVLALVMAACSSDDDGGANADGDGDNTPTMAVFGAEQWPECLNPITCSSAAWLQWTVTTHVLPRAMELDADAAYTPSPVLAGTPTITEDPFTVTYAISPDAVWSDGTPITSADFAFTKDAYLETTASLRTKGYDKITEIDTSDPATAVLTFSEPYAPWQDLFGGGDQFLLPAHVFEGTDLADEMLTEITFSGGPWTLARWSENEAVLEPNDAYWDADRAPEIDQVVFVPRTVPNTAVTQLKDGQLLAISPQPYAGLPEALEQDNVTFTTAGGNIFEGLWPNHTAPPLDDPIVREAIATAIDREEILDLVVRPTAPGHPVLNCAGWVDDIGPWCDTTDFADFTGDQDAAATLLTDNGWARNDDGVWEKDGVTLSMDINTVADNKPREDTQDNVMEQLKDFGVDFTVANEAGGTFFKNTVFTFSHGLGIWGLSASPDPSVTTMYACDQIPTEDNGFSGFNVTGWCDPAVDELLATADATVDPEARLNIIRQIGDAVREDVVWIPLYAKPLMTAWRTDRLGGPIGDFTAHSYGSFANMYDWTLT